MKIIVMDRANVRIEVLDVADHMLEDGIESFLHQHGYSLNEISWMAAAADYVPVQFHGYAAENETGNELHTVRHAQLKNFSICESVEELKRKERDALAAALRKSGKRVEGGHEKYSLVGVDGNAFSIMGYVRISMRKERYTPEEIEAYTKDAMSGDYNHLLMVSFDMIEKLNKKYG